MQGFWSDNFTCDCDCSLWDNGSWVQWFLNIKCNNTCNQQKILTCKIFYVHESLTHTKCPHLPQLVFLQQTCLKVNEQVLCLLLCVGKSNTTTHTWKGTKDERAFMNLRVRTLDGRQASVKPRCRSRATGQASLVADVNSHTLTGDSEKETTFWWHKWTKRHLLPSYEVNPDAKVTLGCK